MGVIEPVLIGIAIGILSGLVGVGGGALLVPMLILFYGMDQHKAQGTSLAMLLAPSGFFAFWKYYKTGHADLKIGLLVALGLLIGGYFGGDWAQRLSSPTLKRIFATFLIAIAVKMFISD